jgi:general L-amino acid transport system permease protein
MALNKRTVPSFLTRQGVPLWRDVVVLQWVAQVVSAIIVIAFLVFFITNVLRAAEIKGLSLGFDFIGQAAGFDLPESMISYTPADSFGRAFLAGFLNTVKVAAAGIVLATVVGTLAALARLSSNWLVSRIGSVYIEIIRNVPLLVQLFFWYFGVFQQLPPVKESIVWPGPIYLSQRGLYTVAPVGTSTFRAWLGFLVVGVVGSLVLRRILLRYQLRTGRDTHYALVTMLVLIGLPLAGWFLVGQAPLMTEEPVLGKFNFTGGLKLTPEFAALLTGLVVYTGAFIAEVVRAGIQAVSRGQFEAARALGLNASQVLRLVIMPQALRVIVPPLISQYLNLTKNSSLAIGIGYADIFFVGRTVSNQAGRAVPVFAMIMVVYLMASLLTSVVMNIYNRRIQLVER